MRGAETSKRTAGVAVSSGILQGRRQDGCLRFRGVPYAAPPCGERRWRPPAPVEPWAGVRDATEPSRPAPQLAQAFDAHDATDEDCLALDVIAPDGPGADRPVVVWWHGGGGTNGSNAGVDPSRLALEGDVVVVVPHHRLGILACFGYPGLAHSGVFGLQDQLAALRWVRREITAFGGDPSNVTLAGMSYGALMVTAQLASPAARGLVHRAILQSPGAVGGETPRHVLFPGAPHLPRRWATVDEVEERGRVTAAERGWVPPGRDHAAALAALRRVPARELLADSGEFIRPAVGGPVLPEAPEDAARAGRLDRVPLMLGTTRDEARFFVSLFGDLAGRPVTAESYPRLVAEAFGGDAREVAARYPLDDHATPGEAWARLATDRGWARPAWEFAQAAAAHTKVWCYEFADPDAPSPVPGLPPGPQHGSDLPYLFDVPGAPTLPAPQQELGRLLRRYWAAFAERGDPNHAGGPPWPDLGTGHVQSLAPARVGPVDYAAEHLLDLWADVEEGSARGVDLTPGSPPPGTG